MNLYYFIASRLSKNRRGSFSAIVTRIAIASISIGLAIMLAAFAILIGFQESIQHKLFSFAGHIQVSKRSLNQSLEKDPLSTKTKLYQNYQESEQITNLNAFALKAGIIKTEEEVAGLVLKGIDANYQQPYFKANMREGSFIKFDTSKRYSSDIIISRRVADKLKLQLHDSVLIFFVQRPPRFRRLVIRGIYETGMEGFDEKIALVDLALIQRLNNWESHQVGGYELLVKDFEEIEDEALREVIDLMEANMIPETVTYLYQGIFDWLLLLNKNVAIFLGLILFVACFNMISVLLIMIMERIPMIGTLKALGATNWQVRKIFIYQGLRLILKGIFLGNLIGLGFCALQYYFSIIPLDAENYYVNKVPIAWSWSNIILLNLLIFSLVSLILLLPTLVISRIRPIKAIRFD